MLIDISFLITGFQPLYAEVNQRADQDTGRIEKDVIKIGTSVIKGQLCDFNKQ